MIVWLLAYAALAQAPLPEVCSWADQSWQNDATLLVPGTNLAYARVWGAMHPRTTGVLGPWGVKARYRGTFQGLGFLVTGDVDVAKDAVFRLYGEPVSLGTNVVMTPWADVRVLGFGTEGVVITGGDWTFDRFKPKQTPRAQVSCEQLSVHRDRSPYPREVDFSALHLPPVLEKRRVPAGAKVKVRESAGGPVIGTLRTGDYEFRVPVVEQTDGWLHIAHSHWQGVQWHGWIEASATEPHAPGEGMGGIFGALDSSLKELEVASCDADQPLHAEVGGRNVPVGTLLAGAEFVVLAERGEQISIAPRGGLDLVEGAELRLPAAAGRCPRKVLDPAGGLFAPGGGE